ncbi:MAG: hypothetical protein ABIS47_08925 [Acidimicrobiales bacterium]
MTGRPGRGRPARLLAVGILGAGLAGCGGGPGEEAAAAPRPRPVLDRRITFSTNTTTPPVLEATPEPAPATAPPTTPSAVGAAPTTAGAAAVGPTTTMAAAGSGRSPGRTACTAVAHIGDSTSVGMMSAAVIADPAKRLDGRYAAAGVTRPLIESSGGRSIVERLPNQENGFEVATRLRAAGFSGCWVVALGTCDAANVAKGSRVTRIQRIERMMSVIGTDPVLWVEAATRVSSGSWANANMQLWNTDLNVTLNAGRARHPNARIYQWTAQVQPAWFASDGIHYTSTGYAARAGLVADALAATFPA